MFYGFVKSTAFVYKAKLRALMREDHVRALEAMKQKLVAARDSLKATAFAMLTKIKAGAFALVQIIRAKIPGFPSVAE